MDHDARNHDTRDHDDMSYHAIIEAESARIAAALAADRDGRVPWSDRWTVATVAKHVGGTHHVVAQVIEDRPTADFGRFATLGQPDKTDPALGAWLTEGTDALVGQLRQTDPDVETWSWYADGRTAGFWLRRMAHETLVHRWDAEAGAGGATAPMDAAVAADALDEYLDVFVATTRALNTSPAGPTVAFVCEDAPDAWALDLGAEGGREVRRGDLDGAALTLRGPAESVLLFAWGRLDANAAGVDVTGDAGILDRWTDLLPPM